MRIDPELCILCGNCAASCPAEAIEAGETSYVITDACLNCGTCVMECPNAAIEE